MYQLPVIESQVVGDGEDRQVHAQVPGEPWLRAEGEGPDLGVQPVGADHQIEAARCGPFEGDLHRVRCLGDPGDRIAEQVLGVAAGGLIQDAGQVAAHDLHVGGVDDAEGRVHAGQMLSGGADVRHPAGARARLPQRAQDPSSPGDVDRRAADVDRLAPVARCRCPFDHRRAEAVPGQPVREGQAGPAPEISTFPRCARDRRGARPAADAGADMGTSVCSAGFAVFDAGAGRAVDMPVSFSFLMRRPAARGQVFPGRFSCSGSWLDGPAWFTRALAGFSADGVGQRRS